MGIESLRPKQTFGLEELGLLGTTPLRPVDTIVDLCAEAIGVPLAAFIVFDDSRAALLVRSVSGTADLGTRWLHAGTSGAVCEMVRDQAGTVQISDLGLRGETENAVERQAFGAAGFLGAPVLGPVGEVAGVLAAISPTERHWTKHERHTLGSYAYLMSEQVMLRAALQTIRLMASERTSIFAHTEPRH